MKKNPRQGAAASAGNGATRRRSRPRRAGAELATLTHLAGELRDREAIRQLPIAYAHFIRTKNAEGIVGLYAKGAVFDVPQTDRWQCIRGHFFEMVEDDEAEGSVYIEFRTGAEGLRASHVGCFRDNYVKEAGVWKFRSRELCAIPLLTADAGCEQ